MFYSASANAFFAPQIREIYEAVNSWPKDAIKATDHEWQAYGLSQAPIGKQRGADAEGRPVWIELPETPIDKLADQAMQRINSGYQFELNALLETYPQAETLTFDKQEREAREWQAWQINGATGNEPSTPLLSAIAQGRSMPKEEIVARVIAKADAWIEASGYATGKRQAKEDRIAEALENEDRAVLESITW